MKKLTALFLAMAMSVSLTACGGPDKQPAIDAFNEASDAFDALSAEINSNVEAYPQDLIDVMNEMADAMIEHKTILESDQELTEENIEEMIKIFGEVKAWSDDTAGQLDEILAEAEAEAAAQAAEIRQPLIDTFNTTSAAFNEFANVINANPSAYPEDIIDVMIQMSDALNQCQEVLESDIEITEEQAAELDAALAEVQEWTALASEAYGEGSAEAAGEAGAVDLQTAKDAFTVASTAFNEVAVAINEDVEAYPEELVDVMIEMSGLLTEYKGLLESGEALSEEDLAAMIEWFSMVETWAAEAKAEIGI